MNSQIYEEATEWVLRHRSDELDVDSRRRFDVWLRESPQHVHAYLEMSSIWEGVSVLDPSWYLSADELIARAHTESNVHPLADLAVTARTRGLPSQPRPRRYSFALAASVLIVAFVASWLYLQRGVYSTDIGEQRTITLADGSSVELNARSRVRVRYSEYERDIDLLRGQALFKVAKDPSRPFIVASNGTQVRAVGTQFDVYRKNTGTLVTVVEGRVAVDRHGDVPHAPQPPGPNTYSPLSAGEGEVLLVAGEQLLVAQAERAPKSANPTPKPANLEAATAWTEQRLVFDDSALTEVAEEFNRYNRRPLVIEDESLNDLHISGTFSSTDPSVLLRFLRDQPEVVVNETPDEIRISRRTGAI